MAIAAGTGSSALAQTALDTANTAKTTADTAQATATTAGTNAFNAFNNANAAANTAGTAQTTATAASTTATLAKDLAVQSFEGATLVNGILSTSVSAGALTISILTAAGNTPTALDAVPVQVTFRDNTATTSVIQVIAAKTITIPSGAQVGVVT